MDDEVICLSDDDDVSSTVSKVSGNATAQITITNVAPLDLRSMLGFNNSPSLTVKKPASSVTYSNIPRTPLVQHNRQPYQNGVNGHSQSHRISLPEHARRSNSYLNNSLPVRPPSQLPSRIERSVRNMVPLARTKDYNFEVFPQDGEFEKLLDVTGCKFKCTFNHCNRIMVGNVSFICHLWAHAVEVLPAESNRERDIDPGKFHDVRGISTCPQCLLRLDSPYKMQIHYTRCHSRVAQAANLNACTICEKEVPFLRNHLELHPETEAPYHCFVGRCKFRCTQRMVLFNHYVNAHKDTPLLWCPFCHHTEQVSRSQLRTKETMTCKGFVAHMKHHFQGKRYQCNKCAYHYFNKNERLKHGKDHHVPYNEKWKRQHKKADAFRRRTKGGLIMNGRSRVKPICPNCRLEGRKTKKCVGCLEEAFKLSLVYLRPTKAGYYIWRKGFDTKQYGRYLLTCGCGYSTRDGTRMARHRHDFCTEIEKLEMEDGWVEPTEITPADHEEDEKEAFMFAIAHPETICRSTTTARVVRPHLQEIDKIRDELIDIDEAQMLVSRQFLVRARFNSPMDSINMFRKLVIQKE